MSVASKRSPAQPGSDWQGAGTSRASARPADRQASRRLRAPIFVFEPHDIILAQIIAALHFDDAQRLRAGVLDAVARLDRNVRRLVRSHVEHVVAARDACLALHDNPMLAALVMELQ